ncbi:MAG: transpeptidase family protein [Bacteroidales bacterium]|nr:transpeptidase family protein [Bacteroidales bacterium]MBD5289011.1 transpeptidase family protein [Bacteroides sp.]
MAKQNNKKHILFRYGLICIGFVLFSILVVFKMFKTTVIDAGAWNQRAKSELSKVDTIAPERGNILADNGNILACNLKVYDIKIDLRHNKIKALKSVPWEKVDSLADSLDVYFPRIANLRQHPDTFAKYSWHTRLKKEFDKPHEKRPRALRFVQKGTMEDFEKIKTFPFVKDFKGSGFRNPLYKEERKIRMYPYGRMAYRSIGRVNENEKTREIHGYSGLEKDLDTLLYGKPGLAKKVALTNGITNWVATPAQRGYDIRTTIDIDLQDMLEEELYNICSEANAEWGTAILMEVETGEIKAISNIELLENGTYGEALNRAVLPFEPGSVMKPISLMIAFEDGLVKNVTDMVSCAPFQKTSDPHGSGMKTMKQVIEQSSNPGIARVIFRGYETNPAKFYDRMAEMGFFEPIRSGIAGECTPRIRKLVPKDSKGNNITMTARHLDLARQAYGYNTELPPLFTLSVYNAIANGGKYVRPHLVKALIDEEGRDSVIPIQYIRDRICSEETARKVRECIKEVVWGEHGTAKLVRDDRVMVVGKTGTAYPVENGVYNKAKRRYAFAGFFPYEDPKYSCIALVLANGGNSANRTSGQVVKNMAVKMYSRGLLDNSSTYTAVRKESRPVLAASQTFDAKKLSKKLNLERVKKVKSPTPASSGAVPSVIGYDATTAVKILEEAGIEVRLRGSGIVRGQSVEAGTPLKKGMVMTLTLKV